MVPSRVGPLKKVVNYDHNIPWLAEKTKVAIIMGESLDFLFYAGIQSLSIIIMESFTTIFINQK